MNSSPHTGSPEAPDIVEGIEWFTFEGPHGEETDCQCARCGSSVTWVDCQWCDEDGFDGHECGEDCCACLHPEPNVVCDVCDGTRGWHICLSSREWCTANPMAGREHIDTTARKAS